MDKKRRNYKLLVDPMLRGGSTKIYRFEGVDPTVRNTEKLILREFRILNCISIIDLEGLASVP